MASNQHKPNLAAKRNRSIYSAMGRRATNKIRRAKKNGVKLVPQKANMKAAIHVLSIRAALHKKAVEAAFEDITSFLNKKYREPEGGSFYQVWSKGKRLCTTWGRSKEDLEKQYNRTRTHFDNIVELV